MKLQTLLLGILLLAAAAVPLFSQEEEQRIIIREVHYITDRYTRESALERELGIPEGKSFTTLEAMESYLENKAQDLRNLRVFEDVLFRYEENDSSETETGYLVAFEVVGSWTIYPIVYPKYDSNTGWRIGSQIYYDNFIGTLTKFYLGGNIDIRFADDKNEIPQWSVNPRFSNLTFGRFTFSIDLFQQYKEITKYNTELEAYEEYYSRNSTALSIGTTINLYSDLYYSFGPSLTWFYGYQDELPDNGSNIEKDDIQFSWSHSIGFNHLDWYGNFREGVAVSFGNSIAWAQDLEEGGTFKTSINASAKGFYIWKRLNPSAMISGMFSFNEEKSGLGSVLRGIRNEDLYGVAAAYLNTSLTISVIPWEGVGEAMCQPYFDIGVAMKEDGSFDFERDVKYSAGADFILYLDALKSLVARGLIGIDLTNPDWSDGRKYEITIESNLAY